MSEQGLDTEYSDKINFIDGAIEYKYKNATYEIRRPSAMETVKFQKQFSSFQKDDLEGLVGFYIKSIIDLGLDEVVANKLDMFSLGELFKALTSAPPKKK